MLVAYHKNIMMNLGDIIRQKGIHVSSVYLNLGIALIAFSLSWANIKQMSYISRITLMILFSVVLYVFAEASINCVYFYALNVDQGVSFNYNKPFFPGFFIMLTQGTGAYEGIAIVPTLFTNSRHKGSFNQNVFITVMTYFLIIVVFSTVCLAAYKDKIEEVILLNLSMGQV
jgi:hypothetical protein